MKHSKRLLALLLVLALSLSLTITTAVAAGDGLTITVGTVSGQAGETVTVPVTISNNPGILSAKLKFSFDSTALELTDMINGEIFTGTKAMFQPNLAKATAVLDNSTADDAVSGNGTLLILTFKIKESAAAGDCEVNVTVTQIVGSSSTNVTAAAVAGKVTVTAVEPPAEVPSMEDVDTTKLPDAAEVTITADGKLNVKNDAACVVLVEKADGSYEKVPAVQNPSGGYEFEIPADAKIVVAVKGDVDGNGKVNLRDYSAVVKSLLSSDNSNYSPLSVFGVAVGDVDGNNKINLRDYSAIVKSLLSSDNNNYSAIGW